MSVLFLPGVAQAQCQGYCESWAVYDPGSNTIGGYSLYEYSGYDPIEGPYEVYVESYIWDPDYNYTYLGSAVGYESVEFDFSYTPQMTGNYMIAGYNAYAVYEGEWSDDSNSSCSVYASPPPPQDPTPSITGISPNPPWQAGQSYNYTISGSAFGTNPTIQIQWPDGSTYYGSCSGQSCDGSISGSLTVPSDAQGTATATVTSNGYNGQGFLGSDPPASNGYSIEVDPSATGVPTYMKILTDTTVKCNGCNSTVLRKFTYQVMVGAGEPWSGPTGTGGAMCETNTVTNWNCTQSAVVATSACSNPQLFVWTDPNGNMPGFDGWSLNSDSFTPVGCGYNTADTWNALAGSQVAVGKMTGYLHTDSISVNGDASTLSQQGKLGSTCMNTTGKISCP